MKLFLDTANLEDIKKYANWGLVDGVTTNPSLIVKEGVSFEKRVKEICKVIKGPVSAEVISTTAHEMIKEGQQYAKWAKNIYVKCPMTAEGLIATQALSQQGIPVNVTLVFSAAQALLAAKAGAAFVSPFIGRIDDMGQDGMELIEEIALMFSHYKFKTEILVASVRTARQVTDAALIGADICTIPGDVFDKLIKHPLTNIGLDKFASDWTKSQAESRKL